MEQDDLKLLWASYNQKLEQQLEFNRDILIRMNFDKSKKALETPIFYEKINIIIACFSFLLIGKWTIEYGDETLYLVSGLISTFLFTPIAIYSSGKKINYLKKLEFNKSSLSSLLKQILEIENKLLKFKRLEPINILFSGLIMCPIIYKGLYGEGIEESLVKYTFFITFTILVGLWFSISFYKNYYDKKLKEIKSLLEELEFEEK